MGLSWHFSTFASSGPPATWRVKEYDGYIVLHGEVDSRLKVCGSAMNSAGAVFVAAVQQPSTASAGRLRIIFSHAVSDSLVCDVLVLMAATHRVMRSHDLSAGTVPRHMRWLFARPFSFSIRSRTAKWNQA